MKKFQKIKEGYDSIVLDVPILKIDMGYYEEDGIKYPIHEFSFRFPYYYDEDDLFKVGVLFKLLKKFYLFSPERELIIRKYGYRTHIKDVIYLENAKHQFSYLIHKPLSGIKILERIPLELSKGRLGYYSIYERYGVVDYGETDKSRS